MARKNMRRDRKEAKERAERLSQLIDEFLESEITEDSLKNNPQEIGRTKELLEKNLWPMGLAPYDPEWQFESDQSPEDFPEEIESIRREAVEVGAKTIAFFHGLLTAFWREFKSSVTDYNGRLGDDTTLLCEKFLRADIGGAVQIHVSFDDTIHLFSSSLEAVRHLMSLIEGLKPEQFKKCKAQDCSRVFLLMSKRRRDYCSPGCAARDVERRKRESNREEFNRYHREYYKNKIKGGTG